ncbi:MAG: hypothetical protein F6J87_15570 [Spirulina sp. SIO3F2]|nr:hypothetical protein [Spirulina sp. SIO3F2]
MKGSGEYPYLIRYDPETKRVDFIGDLALEGPKEYKPIKDLLNGIVNAEPEPEEVTLNLRELGFSNSSGIHMLSKFVMKIRKKKGMQLVVQGSEEIAWQAKSLINLKKLLPDRLTLELE